MKTRARPVVLLAVLAVLALTGIGNVQAADAGAYPEATIATNDPPLQLAIGSFPSVVDVTGETDAGAHDNYSLQLNTNTFPSPLCRRSANPNPFCLGWEQFVYANMPASLNKPPRGCSDVGDGCIYIQYWLDNFDGLCSTLGPYWKSGGDGNCYVNSYAIETERYRIDTLGDFKLRAEAHGDGKDYFEVTLPHGEIRSMTESNPLQANLSMVWGAAYFNVVGNSNGTEAFFNIGATIVVRTDISNATGTTPTCATPGTGAGYTLETNNLSTLSPCGPTPDGATAIQYTESFLGPQAAAAPVAVSDYHNQEHFTYRDTHSLIEDYYSCPKCDDSPWHLQQLNGLAGGMTTAPAATSAPSVAVDSGQDTFHVVYLADTDIIDISYGPAGWKERDLASLVSSETALPVPTSPPVVAYDPSSDQLHVVYLAAGGVIEDASCSGSCADHTGTLQRLNVGGMTNADAAISTPFVAPFALGHHQMHFAYVAQPSQLELKLGAKKGAIEDIVYCGDSDLCGGKTRWTAQQLNLGGLTDAPEAMSRASVLATENGQRTELHFAYLSDNGQVWEILNCSNCSSGPWFSHQLNISRTAGGMTDAPAAASPPSMMESENQQHFVYADRAGALQDVFFCFDCGDDGEWKAQTVLPDPIGTVHQASTDFAPSPDADYQDDQQHFAFVTPTGNIWDTFYCPDCDGSQWRIQHVAGP